jgi:hypothetical protein
MGFTYESFGLGPMPTAYRFWFIQRLNREIEKSNNKEGQESQDIPTKAAHHQTPEVRNMLNKIRPFSRNPRMQRPGSNF